MTMRRDDFKAIAEVLRKHHTEGTIDKLALRDLVDELSTYFRQSNPSFDKGKFVRACGFYQE